MKIFNSFRSKSARHTKGYWIWAGFSDESTQQLKGISSLVKNHLNGPDFPLHLTICGPLTKYTNTARQIINTRSKQMRSCRVAVNGIRQTDHKYESLYLQIAVNNDLYQLREKLIKDFGMAQSKWNPHISLHYGENTKSDKRSATLPIIDRIPESIEITVIWIGKVDEKAEVWRVVDRIPLSQ